MLKKNRGETGVECDECGSEEWAGTLEFREFIDDLKEQGWCIKNVGGEWSHYCPDCEAQ